MDIFLLRHGETDWNVDKRIQGQKAVPLNQQGRLQAQQVAKKLASFPIDTIVSSDLIRALETAQIVGAELGLTVESDAAFRELTYGDWEGSLWRDVYSKNAHLKGDWQHLGADFAAPGGESAPAFRERVILGFQHLLARQTGKCLLLVLHGQSMKMILSCFRPVERSRLFTFMNIGNCQVERIGADEILQFAAATKAKQSFDLLPG